MVQRKDRVKILGNDLGYNRAEGILFSEKWEADELLEPRNYELTSAIQEADKKIS